MYKSILFKGYKLFNDVEYVKIDDLSKVNIIIGKNNSGKSSILDIVEMLYNEKKFELEHRNVEDMMVEVPFSLEMVNAIYSQYNRIGYLNHDDYWGKVNGKNMQFTLDANARFIPNKDDDIPLSKESYFQPALSVLYNQFQQYSFRRISAERNIVPEIEGDVELSSTGEGASNLIREFINNSSKDENIIEKELLTELNTIMFPESVFENIRVQQIKDSDGITKWEVFLKEKGSVKVPLSKMGSGVKTLILVLLNLLVIPKTKEYLSKTIVYGFEELENNLHPALQRKLFDYLYSYAQKNNTVFYLTTHSHIAINTYYDKQEARIYHVLKELDKPVIKKVDSYLDKAEILDDLEVKASDILQSNGIIWVEGPTDRIYIKKWLEVFTPNKYEEGRDFQFLYYGGRLLSQYTTEEESKLINIITTNRNAAIVMDSDKKHSNTPINATKNRIKAEFIKLDMFYWITNGKEIENYLPKEAVSEMIGIKLKKQCDRYQLFPEYIRRYYNSFSNKKVQFANEIKKYITFENSQKILDLNKQITKLYSEIGKWNPQ